jgi:REP element-mobilizing transposase RayT
MVATRWAELPSRFPAVEIGDYVVMPNHLHALIQLRPDMPTGDALTRIVGAFKSLTTNDYVAGVNELGWPRFDGHVWQRSFYDRVVRDGDELARISEYIEANPRLWAEDEENPARGSS